MKQKKISSALLLILTLSSSVAHAGFFDRAGDWVKNHAAVVVGGVVAGVPGVVFGAAGQYVNDYIENNEENKRKVEELKQANSALTTTLLDQARQIAQLKTDLVLKTSEASRQADKVAAINNSYTGFITCMTSNQGNEDGQYNCFNTFMTTLENVVQN